MKELLSKRLDSWMGEIVVCKKAISIWHGFCKVEGTLDDYKEYLT